MIFKCDMKGITAEQLAVICAVQTLYHQQGQTCEVRSMRPLTFGLAGNLTEPQKERLLRDRVPHVAKGFVGVIADDQLVVSKTRAKKPARSKGQARDQGDGDIQSSPQQAVDESAAA